MPARALGRQDQRLARLLLRKSEMFNIDYRKPLDGSVLEYFDVRQAINDIEPGAFEKLPYTSRVLAENLVRHCQPENLTACLKQMIDRKRELDFPGIRHGLSVTTFWARPRW